MGVLDAQSTPRGPAHAQKAPRTAPSLVATPAFLWYALGVEPLPCSPSGARAFFLTSAKEFDR